MRLLDSLKFFLKFVKPYYRHLFLTFIVGFVKNFIPMILPIIVKYIVDDVIGNSSLNSSEKMGKLYLIVSITFIIYLIVRGPFEYYSSYLSEWISNKILGDIRFSLFKHLQKLPIKFFHNNNSGDVLTKVIQDVEHTKNIVSAGFVSIWLDIIGIITVMWIMIKMNIPLSLIAICVMPFYFFVTKFFYKKLKLISKERQRTLGAMQGHVTERIQGISLVRSFPLENYEQNKFSEQNNNVFQKAMERTKWDAKSKSIVNTITDVSPLLILAFGGYYAVLGRISVGTLMAFYAYVERVYSPLKRLINSSNQFSQSLASLERLYELFEEKQEENLLKAPIKNKEIIGNIKFNRVYFSYDEEKDFVLKDLNLHINKGETIAIVGHSGGGKSSLASLLMKYFNVNKGEILIDGENINHFDLEFLREKVGLVLQDSILFNGTIKDNLLLGKPNASDEELIEACKKAHAHEFISSLPEAYDTKIGERGVKLSGGQKQRISIARIFLKNPPILVFDEATSALDLHSERLIQEVIMNLKSQKTVLIIAHRLSTITHADKIVVIDKGEIIEIGSHKELMEKEGAYYKLYKIQNLKK